MDDLADIKQALTDSVEALALDLFGEPNLRRGRQWRWGRKGSVVVGIAGERRGKFRSWEADTGGSMLDAIQCAHGCDLAEAIRWAKQWLGDDRPALPPRPVVVDVDAEEIERRDKARNYWAASGPIDGTPAEQYLRGRGITPGANGGWPNSIRWHRPSGAAIFASMAPDGTISAIQRIYLHRDGTAKIEDGSKIKRSLGPRYGGAVRFDGEQRALCLAEGPETALSVWYATGIETWAGLGAIGSIDLTPVPISRTIIVCRDDDPFISPSRKAQGDAIQRWRREGRTVLIAQPHERRRRDKSDFNDALIEDGPDAVAARIEAVLTEPPELCDAEKGEFSHTIKKAAMPLPWARKTLADTTRDAIAELWGRRDEETPPALALKVALGLGKTHAALAEAIRWIEDGKGPVVYAVPTHKLSAEIVRRAEIAAGGRVRIAVWRGREADDPETLDRQMCHDIETVQAVQKIGSDPQNMVCMDGDKRCPFADVCGYQRQRQQQAELWIVAHAALFTAKPETIPAPSLVVIDEGFHKAGLRGVSGNAVMVSERQIATEPHIPDDVGKTAELHDVLVPIRRKLSAALADQPDGPLSRSALIAAGLTRDDAIEAGKAEWRRRVEPSIWPGMPAELRRKALAAAAGNAGVPRMARMWGLIADLLAEGGPEFSGCLLVEEKQDDDTGATYRGLRLRWHDDIRQGWQGWIAPTLHIDATLDAELVRPYLPQIELRAEIGAETPHMRVVQYPDRTFSKSALSGDTMIDKVWFWSLAKARQAGGRWLLVVQKDVETAIRARHPVPEFLDLAHHNAIAGRDEWKDVRGLIVVGRTMPPPQVVQSIASALSGRHVEIETAGGWYASTAATLRDKAGNAVTVEVDWADDPLAEAVRRSICDAEIEQIIGRARGVNRTADDPVEVHVLGNVPLSQPVDELAEWTPPSKDEQLFAEHGVWLSSGGDMATVFDIRRATVERDRQRAKKQMVTVPYKALSYGTVTIWKEATYRRTGPRWSQQRVVYDPRAIPDIEAFLRAKLGDLAEFAEVQPEIEAEPVPVYAGGIMPVEIVVQARDTMRSLGWTQQMLAQRIGISRPQLTNALQDRFGLSGDPAARLMAFLAAPPPPVQPSLF